MRPKNSPLSGSTEPTPLGTGSLRPVTAVSLTRLRFKNVLCPNDRIVALQLVAIERIVPVAFHVGHFGFFI